MPKIYVASLAAYNAGTLHGEWLDPLDYADGEDLADGIQAQVIATCPEHGEEWAIHDYDDWPPALAGILGEFPFVDDIYAWAQALVEVDNNCDAFAAYVDDILSPPYKPAEAVTSFKDDFAGVWTSVADYAAETINPEVPARLIWYIDWERLGRDLQQGGDISVLDLPDGQVAVFHAW